MLHLTNECRKVQNNILYAFIFFLTVLTISFRYFDFPDLVLSPMPHSERALGLHIRNISYKFYNV